MNKTRQEAMKARALESLATDLHDMKEQQTLMFEWFASTIVAIDERLQAIEAAKGIEHVPPVTDGEEGEETLPSPEPDKPKRGRPRKVKSNG